MPVPFRDDDVGELGSTGFLKIERSPDGAVCLGALFVVDARGEPLEFSYNRIAVPHRFLWRASDLQRHLERRLTASLLSVCSHQPQLLLCLAEEVGTTLFARDIQVNIPVGRVGEPLGSARVVDTETGEVLSESAPVHVSWQPTSPAEGSPARGLFDHLSAHGLLHEPFERASVGLREVYETAAEHGP